MFEDEDASLFAARDPLGVAPLVIEVPDDRGGARRFLVPEAVRVGLLGLVPAVMGRDPILVDVAFLDAGLY